ncbi:MAG: hypothetical protein DRJ03_16700 [Chloroflexi bacterium]|nr:MAG: hypothetical protein DRJ03_16700 [Chloroflexota bacterium]
MAEILILAPKQAVSQWKVANLMAKYFREEGHSVVVDDLLKILIPIRRTDLLIVVDAVFPYSVNRILQKRWLARRAVFSCDVEGVPLMSLGDVIRICNVYDIVPASNFSAECIKRAGFRVDGMIYRAIDYDYYQSVDEDKVNEFINRYGEYFLYIGALHTGARIPRKGMDILFDAWRMFIREREKCKLIVVTNHHPSEFNLKVPDNVIIEKFGGFNEEDLKALYKGSLGLVFPSRCEGFGLPPLEAMALGVPLIVSDAPAHNEFAIGIKLPAERIYEYMTWWGINQIMHEVDSYHLACALETVYCECYSKSMISLAKAKAREFDYKTLYREFEKFL